MIPNEKTHVRNHRSAVVGDGSGCCSPSCFFSLVFSLWLSGSSCPQVCSWLSNNIDTGNDVFCVSLSSLFSFCCCILLLLIMFPAHVFRYCFRHLLWRWQMSPVTSASLTPYRLFVRVLSDFFRHLDNFFDSTFSIAQKYSFSSLLSVAIKKQKRRSDMGIDCILSWRPGGWLFMQ